MADDAVTTPGGSRGEPDFESALMKVRKRQRKLNKAKRAAEEVQYLNIVAMVDVLTILLIFLLKGVSVSSTAGVSANLTLPYSSTKVAPVEAAKVFITRSKVIVEEKEVAQIFNGAIENRWLSPSNTYLVPGIEDSLGNWLKWHLFFKGGKGGGGKGNLSLEILADKDTPYHIIMQVLYSAGKAAAEKDGHSIYFDNYRLLVMRSM